MIIAGFCFAIASLLIAAVSPAAEKFEIEIKTAVEYGTGGGEKLLLELVRPKGAKGPRPGVIFIHGGGWSGGNRRVHLGQAKQAAQRGYVAVSIGYRLAPKHVFPAQIEDCKCAVRWMRANAEKLDLDAKRIGAVGMSAGAHLAMMLGAMDKQDGLEGKGGHAEHSSKVQAVVSFAGPTDLTAEYPQASRAIVARFIGGSRKEKPGQRRLASPITYVNQGDAPMLLFQGTTDRLVPWQQAVSMADALTQAGVPGRIELLPGLGHGLNREEFNRTSAAMWAFLAKRLGK